MSRAIFFAFAGTRRRMYAGPLGPYIDQIIGQFQGQDYARHSIRCKIRVIADFSRWLDKRHLGAGSVDAEVVQRFVAHRKRTARSMLGDAAALRQMADLLRLEHVTETAARSSVLSERERVEEDFCRHLLQDLGLTLEERFGDGFRTV